MNLVLYVVWLAEIAWSMLRYYWPITVTLIVGVAVNSIFNFPFLRSRFQRRRCWYFLHSA